MTENEVRVGLEATDADEADQRVRDAFAPGNWELTVPPSEVLRTRSRTARSGSQPYFWPRKPRNQSIPGLLSLSAGP